MSVLKSEERVTTDPAGAIHDRHKIDGARQWVRHDVDVFRVTYTTRDTNGQEVVVLGRASSRGSPGRCG
ncbi:MAG: hypothetical protein U0835_16025 [Isosphaeraceae bacterium]